MLLGVSGLFRLAPTSAVFEDVEGAGDGAETALEVIVRFCDTFEAAEETSPRKAFSWLCSEDMAARVKRSRMASSQAAGKLRNVTGAVAFF